MKNNWRIVLLGGVLGGLLLLIGAGLYFWARRLPTADAALPPGGTLRVAIVEPEPGIDVPAHGHTTVSAAANGPSQISSFELWVDGGLVGTHLIPESGLSSVGAATWGWEPNSEGQHVLVVRALDVRGESAYSNAMILNAQVGLDSPIRSLLPLPTPTVTGPPAPPASSASAGGLPLGKPSGLSYWIDSLGSPALPAAPELDTGASGCSRQLIVTDHAKNETGFFIYRLDPGASDFVRIATLGANKAALPFRYEEAGTAGHAEYYVSAFNPAGESPSKPGAADISSSDCPAAPDSSIRLSGARIRTSTPVDRLYCYLSVGKGPWARFPADDGAFVSLTGDSFDMAPFVPPLGGALPPSGLDLDLDCWGWSGGELVDLGTGTGKIAPGVGDAPFEVPGSSFALTGVLSFPAAIPSTMGGTPPPTPAPAPVYLMPAHNFNSTVSVSDCASHVPAEASALGALLCGSAIGGGNIVLIWDWTPTCLFPVEGSKIACSAYTTDIEGFHIYRYPAPGTAGKPALFRTVSGRDWHMKGFPVEALEMYPVRYSVRAFKGSYESPDSNLFFRGIDAVPTTTVRLMADSLNSSTIIWSDTSDCGDYPGLGSREVFAVPPIILSGFDQAWSSDSCAESYAYQGQVHFKLPERTSVGPLYKATLTYKRRGTTTEGLSLGPDASCASLLSFGTAGKTDQAWITAAEPYKDLPASGSSFSIDVTGAVRRWWEGEPNYGLAFTPPDVSFAPGTQTCYSTYEGFVLEVTYFNES
ncbi:MAG: Ig-like domain-containing protein [Anaerolineales bacterium]|nr:Ig-like domain-containing protein [Anaerolineales bacterium]